MSVHVDYTSLLKVGCNRYQYNAVSEHLSSQIKRIECMDVSNQIFESTFYVQGKMLIPPKKKRPAFLLQQNFSHKSRADATSSVLEILILQQSLLDLILCWVLYVNTISGVCGQVSFIVENILLPLLSFFFFLQKKKL